MLETGQVVNEIYQVLEPIGEGGAGQVFLAWHKHLQKKVVIKRIKDSFVGRINERGEADILKKLHHRYLPQVYDFIQMDNEVYTVIDYIDGNPLLDYINENVRFDEFQIVKWLKQLCEALDYLHSQNPPIIHSDIKPSNIMVDVSGDICLIDFNISFDENDMKKVSGYTDGYASPEQIRKVEMYTTGGNYLDVHLDARSDIFSLGASIYHIMTLQNPITIMSSNAPLWETSLPLPYSELLIAIIEKALRRNPNDRYQSARAMLNDLETMRIRDKRYRRLNRAQLIYNVFFAGLLVAGGFLVARGSVLRNAEDFDAQYAQIVAEADLDDYNKTISDSIDLLNNRKYEKLLENRTKEKADLLFLIANAYFENDDYENAISFYEKTIQSDDSNPEYFRDHAIANARTGNIDKATEILNDGIERGLSDADLYLVNAEIKNVEGSWDAAIEDFQKVIKTTGNENTLGRAYTLCARAYRSSGDLYGARDILETAYKVVNDTWRLRVLREEGATCIQYIEENGGDEEWLEAAEKCYGTLTNSERATFNDWMNYSLIKEMRGEDSESILILEHAKEKYPEEYRIPMRQAMFEIDMQTRTEENDRNYRKAEEYYEEAERLYGKAKNSGDSDDEMQRLEGLMQEVYDKGWLERKE